MASTLERVTLDELKSWPLGPNHVVATVSMLLVVGVRVTVQVRDTTFSLMKRPVLTDTSTLNSGTKNGSKVATLLVSFG